MIITCPRCLTSAQADIEDGQRVECPTCGHKWDAHPAPDEPPSRIRFPRLTFKRVATAGLAVTIVAVLTALGVLIVRYGGPAAAVEAIGAVAGFALIVFLAVLALCWIIFPFVVVMHLGRIRYDIARLREIAESSPTRTAPPQHD